MERAITWLIVFITLWLLVGLLSITPSIICKVRDCVIEYDKLKAELKKRKKGRCGVDGRVNQ